MSDDRELVELLAAIDATPRASWVAGLRADLDAAWEIEDAGYLDSLRTTTVAVVDHEPTQPTSGHRWPILIAAVAAVLLVGVLVVYDGDRVTPADEPSTTVTVPPTVPPRALHNTSDTEQLAPGTYFVDEVSGIPTPRIFATIGTGWSNPKPSLDGVRVTTKGWAIGKSDTDLPFTEMPFDVALQHHVGIMTFSHPVAVYSDSCHWKESGYRSGPVDTVDGFVTALTEQQGWAEVTTPTDISIDGYIGKAFQRTAPADISDCSTRVYGTRVDSPGTHPHFRSWDNSDGEPEGGFYYEPGQIETLWVLDIEGTVVVISTSAWPEPSAGASPDFAADVLDSIRIERP